MAFGIADNGSIRLVPSKTTRFLQHTDIATEGATPSSLAADGLGKPTACAILHITTSYPDQTLSPRRSSIPTDNSERFSATLSFVTFREHCIFPSGCIGAHAASQGALLSSAWPHHYLLDTPQPKHILALLKFRRTFGPLSQGLCTFPSSFN